MPHVLYVPGHPESFYVFDLPTQAADHSILLPILFHVLSI